MTDLFTSQWFQIIGVTIITSSLGIFVKYVSRNDKYTSFKKEDLSIGLELIVTSLIVLITDSVNKYTRLNVPNIEDATKTILQSNLQIVPWLILVLVIGLWGTSTVIRKIGWENEDELKISWGILFPNIIGLTMLIIVFIWVKS